MWLVSTAAALTGLPASSDAASPTDAIAVTRAVYRAVPQKGRLQITADLELRQSAAGTQTLPLNLGAASLESATLDDQPAPLMRNENGRVLLIGTKRGTSKLQLHLSLPLHRIGRDRSAVLTPIANAPATLTVEVPANRVLQIDGHNARRANPIGEKTERTLAVGNRGPVKLRFTSGAPANGLDSVVLAESRSTLALAAGLADWKCETRFLVSGTPRQTFASSIAGRMQITGVTGPDVADWSVAPSQADPARNTVRVTFRRPFTGTRTVQFTGRTALPTEPFWQVPNFVIDGVDSHAGHVAVSFPRTEEIRVDEFAGLRQSAGTPVGTQPKILPVKAVSTTGSSTSARRTLEFDFWKQDFELNLVLPKRRSVGAADVVTVFDVHRKDVQMKFAAAWVAGETQRWASLSLPAEWSIRTVTMNGKPADWKSLPVEADVQHLRIAVPDSQRRRGQVHISGTRHLRSTASGRKMDQSPFQVVVPVAGKHGDRSIFSWTVATNRIPAGEIMDQSSSRTVRLEVVAVRDLEYPEKSNAAAVWKLPVVRMPESRLMRGEIFIRSSYDVAVGVSDVDQMHSVPGRTRDDRFAYRYALRHHAGSAFGATVAIRPRPPAFSVESLTVARLDRTDLRTKHEIHVAPAAAGFRTLELLLPPNARQTAPIRWLGSGGRLIHSERVSTQAGRARWKLRFDRTIHQPGWLLLELAVQRPNAPHGPVKLVCVQFPAAERTTGYLLVVASPRQRLDVAASYRIPKSGRRTNARPLPLAVVNADDVLRRFGGNGNRLGARVSRIQFSDAGWQRMWREVGKLNSGHPTPKHAFRYVLPNIDVSLSESRLSGDAAGAPACVHRSLQTILSDSGAMQHSVDYELCGVDGQEVRVELPDGAELWAAMCDGKPIEVRRSGNSLLLRPARELLIPGNARLQLIYYDRNDALRRAGQIQLSTPTIAVASRTGFERPLTIRSSSWAVYHPQTMDVTRSAGEFRPVRPLDEPGWLKRLGGWIAARSLLLLIVLLAVPFGWIIVRFLRAVAQRRNGLPLEYRIAGFIVAMVVLFAVTLSGRSSGPTEESADSREELVEPPVATSASLAAAELQNITVQQPVEIDAFEEVAPSAPNERKPISVGRSARLSVPVRFEPSNRLAVKRFAYLGVADGPARLQFTYQSRSCGLTLRLCVIVGMLLGSWVLRRRSRRSLGTLAVLGLTLPAVLAGWFPGEWQPYVDGVFFGTFACMAVWGLRNLVTGVIRHRTRNVSFPGVRTSARILARLLPLSVLIFPAANAEAGDVEPTPPKAFVSAANYEITFKATDGTTPKTVAVTARFHIVSREKGTAAVALPLGRVAITSATLDGKPAAVAWRTVPQIIVPDSGRHVLQLQFSLSLQADASGMRFLLPARPLASGRAVIKLPPKLHARFRGLVGTYHRTIRDGKPIIEFPVDKSRDVTIHLSKHANEPPAATALVESATSRVDIKDSGIFQRDELTLRVANGGLQSWTCHVPGGCRVIGISGRDVAGWELSTPRPEARTVRVDFRRPVTSSTTVTFRLFRAERFDAEPASITLQPVRATSAPASGRIMSVVAGNEFVIRGEKGGQVQLSGGNRRVQLTSSRKTDQSPRRRRRANELAWRLSGADPSVALQVSRRMPQTAVAAKHAVLFDAGEVRITSRLMFDFLGSPRTKLSLLLPEGYTLQSLRGSHHAQWSHGADESTAIVVFPKPQSGTVRVVLDGTLRRKPSSPRVELMLPGPMIAHKLTVTAGFWHAAGVTARLKTADGWKQLANGAFPVAIRARHSQPPVAVLQTSSPEPAPLAWELGRPATKIHADALTLVRVTDTAVQYSLLMKWTGAAGARRSVAFSVPQWIGRKLQFRASRQLRIEPDLSNHDGDGRMRWIVTSFDRTSREIAVVATATLPPPLAAGNRVVAPKPELLRRAENKQAVDGRAVEYAAVKHSRQFVVLLNDSEDRLERAKTPKFRDFTLADLPQRLRISERLRERIARAGERLRTDGPTAEPVWTWKPALRRRRTAVVNRAELTTLLERDGSWRLRAVYRMQKGGRRYLAVKLPTDSRLVQADVAGRPVATGLVQKKGATFHLILLPGRAGGEKEIAVRLLVLGRLPEGSFRANGLRSLLDGSATLSLPAPRVATRKDDAELGIPVQETFWTVRLPDGLTGSAVSDTNRTNVTRTIVEGRRSNGRPEKRNFDVRPVDATTVRPSDARTLYELNCSGINPADDHGERVRRGFAFPLEEESNPSAAVYRDTRPGHLMTAAFQGVAQAWAASVESRTVGPTPQRRITRFPTSLDFDVPVPRKGQTLTFRKAGGEPQLTLRIRTREATQNRRRILWSLVWAAFGIAAVFAVRRATAARMKVGR